MGEVSQKWPGTWSLPAGSTAFHTPAAGLCALHKQGPQRFPPLRTAGLSAHRSGMANMETPLDSLGGAVVGGPGPP